METQVFDARKVSDVDNTEEFTPLMWACYEGDRDRVDELLKEGAVVEEKDNWGRTALTHACCTENNGYIIRTLISHGANVNSIDICGVTPLMITFKYGSYNEWELRVGGAELDAIDNKGRTALMYACDAGDISGQQLCYNGANVDIIDNEGRSALDYALESGEIQNELVHRVASSMEELKTRSNDNDRLLRDELSKYVSEYAKEIVESRSKKRHRWGGHYEKFMLREESYELVEEINYNYPGDSDKDNGYARFHGISPLIYACINGSIDLILKLCSQKGTFFSPDFKNQDSLKYLTEYQKEMERLAIECQPTDVKPCKI